MSSINEHTTTTPAELTAELAGCRIRRLHQEGINVVIDLDESGDERIRLIGEIEGPIAEILTLNHLPPWHDGRAIAWADLVGEHLIVALESGNQIFLGAQSLRVERGV